MSSSAVIFSSIDVGEIRFTSATVPAARPHLWLVLLATEGHATVTAIPSLDPNFCTIEKQPVGIVAFAARKLAGEQIVLLFLKIIIITGT